MVYKILLADDNLESIQGFEYQLAQHHDIEAVFVTSGKEAIKAVTKNPYGFAAVVLDFHFEEENTTGAVIAAELLKLNKNLPIDLTPKNLTT